MNQTAEDILNGLRACCDLGHQKRNEAFVRQVSRELSTCGASAPPSAGKSTDPSTWAELMAMYRFAANDKITLEDVRAARAATVLRLVPAGADVLLVHDMSPLDYSRHNSKTDRRPIGDHQGMGYEYVCCLAIDPHSGRPWGVIHDTVINAEGPDDRPSMDYDYEPLFEHFSPEEKQRLRENHRHQMAVHVNATADRLAPWHTIDVADREFDDIFVVDRCTENDRDFVIRSSANRNVQVPRYSWIPPEATAKKQGGHPAQPDHVCANLSTLVNHVPLQPYKSVSVDTHNRVVQPDSAKRWAELSIGAFQACLYRPAKRNKKYFKTPRPVQLNVVVIREIHPPAQTKPLCWVLFTSLPVQDREQLDYVGLIYERRWGIEQFFRLLKSGFHMLDLRLNNAQKIARRIVVITLAAMAVLGLKQQLGLPEKGRLDDEQYQRMKNATRQPENPDIDLNWRLFALVAKRGGWIGRRSDPIGPTILMRGMMDLIAALDLAAHVPKLIQQATEEDCWIRGLICV
jgi:hypothetical protein